MNTQNNNNISPITEEISEIKIENSLSNDDQIEEIRGIKRKMIG